VELDGGVPQTLDRNGKIFASDVGYEVQGSISRPEPEQWGPDAEVLVRVGNITVKVAQRTEGRLDDSRSMLDLSVNGLDAEQESIGGWLGADDSMDAGVPPQGCSEEIAFSQVSAPEGSRTGQGYFVSR